MYTDRQKKTQEYVDNLNIPIFNPKIELKDRRNFSCLIFAKRNSGKTYFLKDFMYQIKDFYTECYVFCETIDVQKDAFEFVPKKNQYNSFDENKIEEIYHKQQSYIEAGVAEGNKKENLNHICLIFDDFIGNPKVKKSKIFKDLFILSRHINISVICLSQSIVGVSKDTRRNADIIVSFFIDDRMDREALCNQFLSIRNDKNNEGDCLMRKITLDEKNPYQCMIILNFKKAINHEVMVRRYTAKAIKKFLIETKDNSPRIDLRRRSSVLNNKKF